MNITPKNCSIGTAVALALLTIILPLPASDDPAASSSSDVAELAAKIDQHVARAWQRRRSIQGLPRLAAARSIGSGVRPIHPRPTRRSAGVLVH